MLRRTPQSDSLFVFLAKIEDVMNLNMMTRTFNEHPRFCPIGLGKFCEDSVFAGFVHYTKRFTGKTALTTIFGDRLRAMPAVIVPHKVPRRVVLLTKGDRLELTHRISTLPKNPRR